MRDGDALCADVGLDEEAARAGGFDLHPALLEAVLQALALTGRPPEMPFSFSGVRLHRRGAASLRARLVAGEAGWGVVAADADGAAVAVDRRRAHPRAGCERRPATRNALFAVEWTTPAAAPEPPGRHARDRPRRRAPPGDELGARSSPPSPPARRRPSTSSSRSRRPPATSLARPPTRSRARALELLQAWLAAERSRTPGSWW